MSQSSGPDTQSSGPDTQSSGPDTQSSGPDAQSSGPDAQLIELHEAQLEIDYIYLIQHPQLVQIVFCHPVSAYRGLTIKQLNEEIEKYELKPPKLTKSLLIEYLRLIQRLSLRQVLHHAIRNTFKLKYYSWGPAGREGRYNPQWIEHLYKFGFTTIPVLNPAEANYFRTEILNYAQNLRESTTGEQTPFRANDPQTWDTKNYTSPTLHGLIKEHCAHTQIAAMLRMRTAHIFAQIWQCSVEHLRMPLDSFCILPPAPEKENGWLHCDCPYDPSQKIPYHLCSIQGMLNLSLADEPRGSFVCIPNSNHVYPRYCERNPPTYIGGFGKTNLNDPELSQMPIAKVCAQPGVLILWLTSVVHANTPAPCPANDLKLKAELGLRVSMSMTAFPYHKELYYNRYARARAYMRGKSTGHWLYGPSFKVFNTFYRDKESWIPGKNQVMGPPAHLLELYRHWFGLYDLDSAECNKLFADENIPNWHAQATINWKGQLPR